MNEETVKKWIIKAEEDLKIGKDEINAENPATGAICFHMQQCVEKYLKAYLVFHGKEFRKTHDIEEILNSCVEIDAEFEKLREIKAPILTKYAIGIRYPDEFYFPTLEEAKECIEIVRKTKDFVSEKLKDKGFGYEKS